MSFIEKQTELTKTLVEINTHVLQDMTSLQRENLEKYFETNRTYGERLPEIKSISDFLGLQREYGETLMTNAREAFETQNEIVKTAFEDTSAAFRTAFTAEAEEAPKPAPKKKAKAKAKKPAAEAA